MAVAKDAETRLLAVTTTDQQIDFGSPKLDKVIVISDQATVRLDFDQPTDDGSFPLLTADVSFEFDVRVNKVHASTSSGTANLYIIGIRKN